MTISNEKLRPVFLGFCGLGSLIGIIILILYVITRVKRLILTMKDSVDGSPKWCLCENITNFYCSIYDHLVTLTTIIMMILNIGICILLLLFTLQELNSINNTECIAYIYGMHICYILSRILQYKYVTLLVRIITNETSFEESTQKYLRILWISLIICLCISIYFAFETNPFDTRFEINMLIDCSWKPSIYFKVFFCIIDTFLSFILLWLLVRPLRASANNVHKRLTSLREDPLHQAMWKYILLMSFICIAALILSIIGLIDDFESLFGFALIFAVTISNLCTYLLFIETSWLIKCCFNCLDCIDCCLDKCCPFCCESLKASIKDETSLQHASYEFSLEVSKSNDNNDKPKHEPNNGDKPSNNDNKMKVHVSSTQKSVTFKLDNNGTSDTETVQANHNKKMSANVSKIISPKSGNIISGLFSPKRRPKTPKEISHYLQKSATTIPQFHKNPSYSKAKLSQTVVGQESVTQTYTTDSSDTDTNKGKSYTKTKSFRNGDKKHLDYNIQPINIERQKSKNYIQSLQDVKSETEELNRVDSGGITDFDSEQKISLQNNKSLSNKSVSASENAHNHLKTLSMDLEIYHQQTISKNDKDFEDYIKKNTITEDEIMDDNNTIRKKKTGPDHSIRLPSDYTENGFNSSAGTIISKKGTSGYNSDVENETIADLNISPMDFNTNNTTINDAPKIPSKFNNDTFVYANYSIEPRMDSNIN